jgi:hypothetical protein
MVRNADGCPPYEVESWRLRSAGAMPIGPAIFLVQAFGAEESQIDIYTLADELPRTEEFAGASVNADYVQASFQRLPFAYNGRQVFQGSITHKPVFHDENDMPGESGWY